jgi:hypothetical protein
MMQGCRGKTVGMLLNLLLEQVVDEHLPNEKQTLLLWAQKKIKENTL